MLTALENVEFVLLLQGVPEREHRRHALEVLEQLGIGELAHKLPHEMSGGQQQRVAGARVELLWEQGHAISLGLDLDHPFSPQWYGLVEYRNGRGAPRPEAYDWPALTRGEDVQMGRDELALLLQYKLHPLVQLQVLHLRNLNDWSFYTGLQLTWLATWPSILCRVAGERPTQRIRPPRFVPGAPAGRRWGPLLSAGACVV